MRRRRRRRRSSYVLPRLFPPLFSSILLLSLSKHAIQFVDFTREKRKLIAATTSVRGIPIKRNNRWIRSLFLLFVFYLLEDKRHANLISSILEKTVTSNAPPTYRSIFFFFFSSLSFLANIDSFQPRRVFETWISSWTLCRVGRIGIKFHLLWILIFFTRFVPFNLIFLLVIIPISKLHRDWIFYSSAFNQFCPIFPLFSSFSNVQENNGNSEFWRRN